MEKYHKKEYKRFADIPKIGLHRVIDREPVNVSYFGNHRPQIIVVAQPQLIVAIPHQGFHVHRQVIAIPRQMIVLHP